MGAAVRRHDPLRRRRSSRGRILAHEPLSRRTGLGSVVPRSRRVRGPARARPQRVAHAHSGPVIACGGLVFALAITAETLPFAYAASAHVFPEATGRGIVDTLNGHFDWLLPAIIGASLAVGVGFLLALIGGLLARALPRWFGIAGIAYIALFVFSPLEQLVPEVAFAGQLLRYALLLGIAWFGLRASRRAPAGGRDDETPGIAGVDVEPRRFELLTSCLQSRRSTN